MSGDTGSPGGICWVVPDGAITSLGYVVHLSGNCSTPRLTDSVRDEPRDSETSFPVAVKGPTFTGALGVVSVNPLVGTGSGMAREKLSDSGDDAGVAPVASMVADSVPVRLVALIA